ncbi:DUF1311 domain-containing protein [Ruegeria pomeroyi]|jgi:uncharacterized protein YecT (DUF1311 family)|uniref:Lysozyme inhibitor LprI-like N-terminal domain-containing protein n=2 Tax=Ruegeria pomeroyi TaxID=89184 RepID=Q5LN65_RUEPO|nr:lysozyme inhibitor LprI family protein [Ruegeria pomeroyi]HCE71139.1 DUF1311 domain-containing protein [Ruegeria sp.]AAV96574.1 hypothetical protein SPO3347 [Ruegeria pomeroyi DSS-3]NVK96166.1 DUF1311 domain-containing protein [Ruegeria pomeroyi]NVL01006.1 DUF1311 domain-containing protein [Ruegeria pomeroyi]QWV10115.1 DUF1311 domain-containing protein [Ruegeria pomeroyi]
MRVLRYAVALALAPVLTAADPALECSDAASQVETGACVSEMSARVEGALAIALEIARGSAAELDEVTGRKMALPALDSAQSAWTAYRAAHCEAVGAGFGGGSGTGIAITSCQIELGRARIDELMAMAQ